MCALTWLCFANPVMWNTMVKGAGFMECMECSANLNLYCFLSVQKVHWKGSTVTALKPLTNSISSIWSAHCRAALWSVESKQLVWAMFNCFLLSYIICEVSYYQFQGGTVQRKCATCQTIYFCHFYSLPCLLLCASVFSQNYRFHLHNQRLRKHSFC